MNNHNKIYVKGITNLTDAEQEEFIFKVLLMTFCLPL